MKGPPILSGTLTSEFVMAVDEGYVLAFFLGESRAQGNVDTLPKPCSVDVDTES
jgi:hypothetical protein